MNIKKITLFRYEKKLQIPFHSSHVKRKFPESVIVCIDFDNGIQGFGESTPRTYVTGEDCQSVIDLVTNRFSKRLIRARIDQMSDIKRVLDDLEKDCLEQNIKQYTSALGAVDLALFDGLGKMENVHCVDYMGPVIRDSITYSFSIPFLPFEKIEKIFHLLKDIEVRYVKVLITEDVDENINRIKRIRSLIGPDSDIRIEVNGTMDYETSLKNCLFLQDYGITAVEQPVNKFDIEGMARFREKVNIPVVADESMCTMNDLQNLIEHESCDIINIKISKCGGLIRSKDLYNHARSHKIQCQLGSHVGETAILTEAGRVFALTTPDLAYIEGGSSVLFNCIVNQVAVDSDAAIRGKGLGLDKDENNGIIDDSRMIDVIGV